MKTKSMKLSQLTPDDKNMNKGTARGTGMLERSIQNYGWGRSALVDSDGKIIAGNKSLETAGAIGMDDVIVVETDGTKPVIVKRTDVKLDSKKGRELALADNRVGELNLSWDSDAISELADTVSLTDFFFDFEIEELLPSGESSVGDVTQNGEREATNGDYLSEMFEKYSDKEIKTITLAFSGEEYNEVVGMIRSACDKHGVDDFSTAVLQVLRENFKG